MARWSLILANWALTNPPWKTVNFTHSAVDDEASGSEWLSAVALIAQHRGQLYLGNKTIVRGCAKNNRLKYLAALGLVRIHGGLLGGAGELPSRPITANCDSFASSLVSAANGYRFRWIASTPRGWGALVSVSGVEAVGATLS
ncbi:hypothetical protein An13g03170 [Aspergillus niger]|uniref:Uncharacterized protein n=2 Tax=Aspergillus niger TaxID=5061 RepID=A2R213_ASPNC|nr:hypothetical protein An13g03170 [Aspergillus niger]CAK41713.1 hypothetical protein An13g03170 [Aspergillus niger]